MNNKFEGSELVNIELSKNYVDNLIKTKKYLKKGTGHIYETIDGKHYRRLETHHKNIGKISEIANGYNQQFIRKLEKNFSKLEIAEGENIYENEYKNIIFSLRDEIYDKDIIFSKFENYINNLICETKNHMVKTEFRYAKMSELIKIKFKIERSLNYDDLFNEIVGDKKNFILKFNNKIKIINGYTS